MLDVSPSSRLYFGYGLVLIELDSGTSGSNVVSVQVRPSALNPNKLSLSEEGFFNGLALVVCCVPLAFARYLCCVSGVITRCVSS